MRASLTITRFVSSILALAAGCLVAAVSVTASAAPMSITFTPDPTLVRAGAANRLTYVGTAVAGTLRVVSPTPGITITVSSDASTTAKTYTTGSTIFSVPFTTENMVLNTPRTYTVQAVAQSTPNVVMANETLIFDAIPRTQALVLVTPTAANTTDDLLVSGHLGIRQPNGKYVFDPMTAGIWHLTLSRLNADGTTMALGSQTVLDNSSDQTFTINAGRLAGGLATLRVAAMQVNLPYPLTLTLTSAPVSVYVRNGEPIAVDGVTRPATGASPFTATVGVWPKEMPRAGDVGTITHMVSSDGTSFTPLLTATGAPVAGPAMYYATQVLTGNTKKFYKAVVANRWSGRTYESQPVALQSFLVPSPTITGPKSTMLGHGVTLTAGASANTPTNGVVYSWVARYGAADPQPLTGTGTTFTIPASKLGVVSVELGAKVEGAPDNPLATKKALYAVTVIPPALPKPIVTGDIIVETGKTYTWKALQPSPFPAGTNPDLTISGKWTLPDGTFSDANPVTYTMKANDLPRVIYTSSIASPAIASETSYALRPWTYVWPDMRMLTTVLTPYAPPSVLAFFLITSPNAIVPYAPAKVEYFATTTLPAALTAMHNEPLTVQWNLPPEATIVSQSGTKITVQYAAPGTYRVTGTISDSRGHSATLTSQETTVLPAPTLKFTLTATNPDRFARPPGPVLARPMVTTLPLNDALAGYTYFLNGQQVGGEVPGAAYLSIPNAGEYTIRAVGRTVKGGTFEQSVPITLVAGDNPACQLVRNGNGTTTLWFQAVCTVQRGFITKYSWKVNGAASPVVATTLTFLPPDVAGAHLVEVTATTDKGQSGTAAWQH